MAGINSLSTSATFSTTSYDTALCIIPNPAICGHIDRLREFYDKAYGKWPPHINLVYPFVHPDNLPQAQKCIQQTLDNDQTQSKPLVAKFDQAGHFEQRKNNTIFLTEKTADSESSLIHLRALISQALGSEPQTSKLHLTIGQSEDKTEFSQEFMLAKARLIPALEFQAGALAILVRERTAGSDSTFHMKLWGLIDLSASETTWKPHTPEYWIGSTLETASDTIVDIDEDNELVAVEGKPFNREVQPGQTFRFDAQVGKWSACTGEEQSDCNTNTMTVSSYNVLINSVHPPARDRDLLLVGNILSDSAKADVLVLQEVSDDFLSFLLAEPEIQQRYPFASHGPPNQAEIGPLPSLRNIVVLGRFAFTYNLVPFQRRHKNAVVARFSSIMKSDSSGAKDLIVAGVHLTCGLTDGSVAAKKIQMQNLTSYLQRAHSTDPWIIAGDFNITTSSYTINLAAKNKSISRQTVTTLASIESMISDAGVTDAWSVARIEGTDASMSNNDDELFDGEQGATFDPTNNVLAAATSGTSNHRPQRYDKILFRPHDTLRVVRFNHFGLPKDQDGTQVVASDHSGVRATINISQDTVGNKSNEIEASSQPQVELKRAQPSLSDFSDLESALALRAMFPTDEQITQRRDTFALLKQVLIGANVGDDPTTMDIPLVLVAVGSYAMGTWTVESDIDCLCVGTISSKTFFKLARQRLMKADSQGVRIMRKVEANTGTMLELNINGVAMDLQYCPAARIVERWSEVQHLPASDPVFSLAIHSLRKLKPYRDLLYIQRTIPSLPTFRLAYRCIKLWAVRRGLYSSRFGYLSGIHITLMLSWAYKKIAHETGLVSAADLVTSFFDHYSRFDWTISLLYDGFFYKSKPRYHRSAREPMVILGFHAPNANVAHTSTVPGLQTLVREFAAAKGQLSSPDATWQKFFGSVSDTASPSGVDTAASEFLKSQNNFIKIDIQFWGRTLSKGKSLVGWVESRCLALVVDVHKALPELDVRIWPARFTDSDATSAAETKDYYGCYLIGLSRSTNATASNNKDDRQLAKQSLEKIVDQFVDRLKSDEKHYDSSICWIDASLARPADVKAMRLDDREWGDYAAEMEPDSDDEEDLDDELEDTDTPSTIQRAIPQRPKPTSTPLSASKLRPASDVLNRLRWDPSLDPSDYIIGYEDRFLGAKETSLERWKTEQTDEEFIPQHRILYFKRKGGSDVGSAGAEIVWERATRIDKVFWSGASASAGNGVEA